MISASELIALLTAILTPILGGYSALCLYIRAQASDRLRDKNEEIDRILKERDEVTARLIKERDEATSLAWRSVTATEHAAATTGRVLDVQNQRN